MQKLRIFYLLLLLTFTLQGQNYSLKDTLRGSNTEYRNWWNVTHYTLTVEPTFENLSIKGEVDIEFVVNDVYKNQSLMQIDLQSPLRFKEITLYDSISNASFKILLESDVKKVGNAYLIKVPQALTFEKNKTYHFLIQYEGKPIIAQRPPWDGGWVFTKDKNGNPWMSVACQGLGASVWYPCKDYQGDEPDKGAILHIIAPEGLVGVGNGRLIKTQQLSNQKTQYTWQVVNPINNYNIIPNIGKYTNFTDTFVGEKGVLDLSYWVLDYNLSKAQKQFEQVKPMLKAFEYWMGPYPFYEDSYKLIETPYLGMEHQSGVAYGNHYLNGYLGNDLSGTGVGLKWDFIIIHESGHEWYGNNITAKEIADMWVQEGFTAYSETLYTQSLFNQSDANKYVIGTKNNIENDIPIIGKYGVNVEGSGDMYYKAANMIHTLRMLMEDDEKFRNMLREMNKTFYHQTVTTQQIEQFISQYSGIDLTAFFNQYLRTTAIPVLEFKKEKKKIKFRYLNIVPQFDMPVQLENGKWIYPTSQWQILKGEKSIPTINPNFLILTQK